MVPRLVLKLSLQMASPGPGSGEHKAGDMLLTPLTHSLLPPSPFALTDSEESGEGLRACLGRVCECVYENSLDACCALLDQVDNAMVLRQALSVVTEVGGLGFCSMQCIVYRVILYL